MATANRQEALVRLNGLTTSNEALSMFRKLTVDEYNALPSTTARTSGKRDMYAAIRQALQDANGVGLFGVQVGDTTEVEPIRNSLRMRVRNQAWRDNVRYIVDFDKDHYQEDGILWVPFRISVEGAPLDGTMNTNTNTQPNRPTTRNR